VVDHAARRIEFMLLQYVHRSHVHARLSRCIGKGDAGMSTFTDLVNCSLVT
jgi:hypothetical protein